MLRDKHEQFVNTMSCIKNNFLSLYFPANSISNSNLTKYLTKLNLNIVLTRSAKSQWTKIAV